MNMQTAPLADLLFRDLHIPRQTLARGGRVLSHAMRDSVFIVLDGAFSVESSCGFGGAQILEVVGSRNGALSGRSLCDTSLPLFLRALVPTTFARLSEAEFERRAAANPAVARAALIAVSHRLAELRERLAARSEPQVHRRIASALVFLGKKIGASCPLAMGTRLQLSQATIADVAGLSRQTANRTLGELQAMGLLRLEHAMVCLLDVQALAQLAGGAPVRHAFVPARSCRFVDAAAALSCYPRRDAPIALVPLAIRRPREE